VVEKAWVYGLPAAPLAAVPHSHLLVWLLNGL